MPIWSDFLLLDWWTIYCNDFPSWLSLPSPESWGPGWAYLYFYQVPRWLGCAGGLETHWPFNENALARPPTTVSNTQAPASRTSSRRSPLSMWASAQCVTRSWKVGVEQCLSPQAAVRTLQVKQLCPRLGGEELYKQQLSYWWTQWALERRKTKNTESSSFKLHFLTLALPDACELTFKCELIIHRRKQNWIYN